MGFNEIPVSDAFDWTPPGGRPSFNPITRVGVFCFASSRSCFTSEGVQVLPLFRVDLLIFFQCVYTPYSGALVSLPLYRVFVNFILPRILSPFRARSNFAAAHVVW